MLITVTTEVAPMCPFNAAMEHLRASMLVHFAKEAGLECEPRFEKHFTDYEVVADEDKGMDLLHTLARKGCVDIHVHTSDAVTKSLLEFSYGRLFRVVDEGK